jgi:hypothetical protein
MQTLGRGTAGKAERILIGNCRIMTVQGRPLLDNDRVDRKRHELVEGHTVLGIDVEQLW